MFLYNVVDQLLTIFTYLVIIRAVMSWFVRDSMNPIYRTLIHVTEPVLSFIRRLLPNMGGIDISPIILILFIGVLKSILHKLLV